MEPASRVISPDLDAMEDLRPPLQLGEKQVLDFFLQNLDPAWEIYVQPFLNGLRPDFVLLNPRVGVAVFEVKDWNLNARDYSPAKRLGLLEVHDSQTKKVSLQRSPFNQVGQYEIELRNIYCPRLRESANIPLLTAGVIFTSASTERARTLCQPEIDAINLSGRRYRPVSGGDALVAGGLSAVFPEAERYSSQRMDEDLAEDLRRWLVEPQHAVEQRSKLLLDSRQRQFASTRTESGFRRIRGPAGSGKTVVVAARAAALVEEGRSVLVVYYNLTLGNYLRDTYVRFGQPRNGGGVTWLNFHEWCRRTLRQAGGESPEEYDDKNVYLDYGMANAALKAIHEGKFRRQVPKYDAILVDEGQDFLPDWWTALRAVLKPAGEMMLVADRAQDIYERNETWTEKTMEGAGFNGPWSELDTCYRMPERLRAQVDRFATKFGLDRTGSRRSVLPQTELDFCSLHWRQVRPDEIANAIVDEFHAVAAADSDFGMTDISITVDRKELGQKVVALLEERGIKTRHTFGGDPDRDRAAKLTFFKGADRVKVTTIHSFKGLEVPILIVGISGSIPEVVYTALSRLRGSEVGSQLHVVCSDQRFSDFGASWRGVNS